MRKNPTTGFIELQNRLEKCLHYYHYWLDEKLGPCHVGLQTWFPFNTFVCVNGREMLAGELTRQLRMLRAHALIQKVAKTHRYQVTPTAAN